MDVSVPLLIQKKKTLQIFCSYCMSAPVPYYFFLPSTCITLPTGSTFAELNVDFSGAWAMIALWWSAQVITQIDFHTYRVDTTARNFYSLSKVWQRARSTGWYLWKKYSDRLLEKHNRSTNKTEYNMTYYM